MQLKAAKETISAEVETTKIREYWSKLLLKVKELQVWMLSCLAHRLIHIWLDAEI